MKSSVALLFAGTFAASASADIRVETYGTAFPPSRVAGAAVKPSPFDARLTEDVMSTLDADGGAIGFSTPVKCLQVGVGWNNWSHGYTGTVYWSNGATDLTMTFDPLTKAVQLYTEPNPFGVFQMTVIGSDGASTITRTADITAPDGASGYGFYTFQHAGVVQSVRITSDVDFAVGEFATGRVPAPAALPLLALAGLTAARRRR